MPLWFWVLVFVGAMLAFGLGFDVRRTRRLMIDSSRTARRAALAERYRRHAKAMRRAGSSVADAERIRPGTFSGQHGLSQQRQQQAGGGMGDPVG